MRMRVLTAWMPLLTLPVIAVALTPGDWPRWGFMWLLCVALFVGCKWLTWWTAPAGNATAFRNLGYLIAWPGLDAPTFLYTANPRPSPLSSWLFAVAKLLLGILLLGVVYPRLGYFDDLVRGWVGMLGIVFVLHFGLFDLLSLAWQALGVTAKPLMNWPVLATSVADFWGQRWNTAFRDLTHRFLYRPLTLRLGAKMGLLVGFLFSGVVHDLVISLPARGGYGGPTAFFLLQAAALFLERSTPGQRLGLMHGLRGWAFTMLVLLGPLFLLFHPPFVGSIIVPFLDWIWGSFP